MIVLKKIFFILLITTLLFSCKSNYQVVLVNKNTLPSDKSGFYYALPKTYLKVDFIINQQENIKGPYSDYAKKYFGLSNVIAQNSIRYSIKDIKIETYSEPDSSQFYFVETNDSKLGLKVNDLGIIESVNSFSNKSVKNIEHLSIDSNINLKNDYPELFKMYANMSLYEKTDTIYKPLKIFNSYILEKSFKTSIIEKPTDQKVKEIADLISKIKDSRLNILFGESDVNDKKSIEFMYEELQNLENEYMKLFTGITLNHTMTYSCIYFPEKDTNVNITKAIICKFSPEIGILDKSNSNGDNVYVQIIDNNLTTQINCYNNNKKKIQKGKRGFYYRIPAYSDVNIIYNNIKLQTSKQLIAQLGVVISLPRDNSFLQFDKNTGAIRQMQIK
ncbi:MAG: DUF4831 family protein [Bacteroidetes bacterium]|nr:DUF4831 family protein [Bacteroidota bacterium]